jgi:hypothetical protein
MNNADRLYKIGTEFTALRCPKVLGNDNEAPDVI